jgi:thiol-disulfide isomerase/thioredoxin
VYAQKKEIDLYYIGDRVPDLPLENIINYKDSVATLSSFGDKMIILDFWNIHCTSCIRMFPFEDSLQAMFPKDVQFILVTRDSKNQVAQFFQRYNIVQKKPLGLPVVAADRILSKLFRFRYIPHYVWIAPNGLIMAESSDWFITKENIENTLLPIRTEETRLLGNKLADFNLHMQKPDKELLQLLFLPNN